MSSQVLLVLRLEDHASPFPITYTIALSPLYAAMLPATLAAAVHITVGLFRRFRPVPGMEPPSWSQLAPQLHMLASRLLISATVCLVGLKGDEVIGASWWLVLLPGWLLVGLLALQWYTLLTSTLANRQLPEEERAARMGGLALLACVGVVLFVSFLLLSLRVGGQADFSTVVIGAPIFGALALSLCCCCCLMCCARLANAAQQAQQGQPPYAEVQDEEAPPAQAPSHTAADAFASVFANEAARSAASSAASPSGARSGAGGAERSGLAASGPLGAERLAALSTKDLKEHLTARGVAHEHCLEKSELLNLLLETEGLVTRVERSPEAAREGGGGGGAGAVSSRETAATGPPTAAAPTDGPAALTAAATVAATPQGDSSGDQQHIAGMLGEAFSGAEAGADAGAPRADETEEERRQRVLARVAGVAHHQPGGGARSPPPKAPDDAM